MTRFLDSFEKVFDRLNTIIAGCVALSIGLFALLVPLDLFLRRLQVGNLEWLHEGAEYVFYVGVFMSSAWVLRKGAHVRVDIVISALSRRGAVRLEKAIDLTGALLCLVLCYFGIEGMIGEFETGALPDKDLRIPNGYMLLIFALAFALLTIEFLFRFRRASQEDLSGHSADTGF